MGEKKDGGRWYQPKPEPVRAIQWNKDGDHPQVKLKCDCALPAGVCVLCEGKTAVLVHGGMRAPVSPGDYLIGPDAQNLMHVFSKEEFEAAYEIAKAPKGSIQMRESKWMQSTWAINSVAGIVAWFQQNRLSPWAQSNPGASQQMWEHQKFLQQHLDAMERSKRGE